MVVLVGSFDMYVIILHYYSSCIMHDPKKMRTSLSPLIGNVLAQFIILNLGYLSKSHKPDWAGCVHMQVTKND